MDNIWKKIEKRLPTLSDAVLRKALETAKDAGKNRAVAALQNEINRRLQ